MGTIYHPATGTTRPYEETVCKHCGKRIWRMTDGGSGKWTHMDHTPNYYCEYPKTRAEP